MIRLLILWSALCIAVSGGVGQFRESVERNARLLRVVNGDSEGYAATVSGETMQYPRMSERYPSVLLTRATTGEMAIEWKTPNVTLSPGAREAVFVVRAGIYGQEDSGKKFHLTVNGQRRYTFATNGKDSWTVNGDDGAVLMFEGVTRDQYRDIFGYLRISVPAEWTVRGEPLRLSIVGEKSGSSAWFMVYQDPAVVSSLREQVADEAYCDLTVETRDSRNDAMVEASSNWIGRKLTLEGENGERTTVTLLERGGKASAGFRFEGTRSAPFKLFIDSELMAEFPAMAEQREQSRIYPRRIVTVTTRIGSSGMWSMEYRSTHAPAFGNSLITLSESSRGAGDLRLIISSHQDIAWMDSPEQCVKDRDEKVITPALNLIRGDSSYRFDLEDVLELREYLGRHPDSRDEIHRLVREGRLGIGASYTMPYEDICSGEMLARQFYAGRRWLLKNFPGCDSRTAWNPDVPGRSAQSLQIMNKAGVRNLVISRHEKGLYDWRSPDGSGVLVFSPHHYALLAERTMAKPFPGMAGYVASFSHDWSAVIPNGGSTVPLLFMSDMSAPVRYNDFINTWNGLKSITREDGATQRLTLPPVRYSTADAFFESVRESGRRFPVVEGERPNIWLYIHGPTHHRALSAKREADAYLPAAEIFSTIEGVLGGSFARYPDSALTEAWESQIYPDHGWGGKNGEITDSLFRWKYEHALEVSKSIAHEAAGSLAAKIRPPAGGGIPLVVFNSLSWKRSAPVICKVPFARGIMKKGIALRNAKGVAVPVQILSAVRYDDGSLSSVEFVFLAADVPSVGYTAYTLVPSAGGVGLSRVDRPAPEILESPSYRLTFGKGGVRRVYDRELDADVFDSGKFLGGELFTMQSVGEDAGEWAEPQQPTMEGFDRLANHAPSWRLVESGPVRQVAESRQTITHVTVVQRVVLYRAVKRVDFETSLLDWDGTKYREFRLAFPLKESQADVAYEGPFAVVEVGKSEMAGAAGERYLQKVSSVRPRGLQNWISASDRQIGVTIGSSVAVWDYQDPTDSPAVGTLLQPVLLASRRSCHGEGPWYLQKGDHHFRFSLTSHRPGWRNGRKFGTEVNVPLIVVVNPSRGGPATLPGEMSFLTIDAENVALSTLKKAEEGGGVIVRLVEMEGTAVGTSLRFFRPVQSAAATDLIEEGNSPLTVKNGEVVLNLGRNAVETARLAPRK